MNEFTIREIIEHAERIETESHAFYLKAAEYLKDPEALRLVMELSEEEIKHYNHLRDILLQPRIKSVDLNQALRTDVNLSDRIVKTAEISPESDADTILQIALEREKQTELLYRLYLTFTDIPHNIIRVFEDLQNQEIGHQKRINRIIKQRNTGS